MIFIHCSKLFVGDIVLFNAMVSDEDELFYKDANTLSWTNLN